MADSDYEKEEAEIAVALRENGDVAFKVPAPPSAKVVEDCRNKSLHQILKLDEEVMDVGMNLFFGNRLEEAEAVFSQHEALDPLAANSKAVLYAGRSILSMEQKYITQASAYLLYASHFAQAVIPPKKSLISSAFSWMGGGSRGGGGGGAGTIPDTRMTPATFRGHVVMAEAEVLRGLVLLLEETLTSYIKAGLALRRAYNVYAMLQDHLQQCRKEAAEVASTDPSRLSFHLPKRGRKKGDEETVVEVRVEEESLLGPDGTWADAKKISTYAAQHYGSIDLPISVVRYGILVDDNSYFAMHFGLGCIHVATSVLPPKVLGVLKSLGYMHDRHKGFHHLENCLLSNTIRSPLASLFLMGFNGTLPSFAVMMIGGCLPAAVTTYDNTLKCTAAITNTKTGETKTVAKYQDSMIHIWLAGRVQRLKAASMDTSLFGESLLACLGSQEDGTSGGTDISIFSKCLAAGQKVGIERSLPQLRHFAMYDLAWSYCGAFEFIKAAKCFNIVEREGGWSKGFYAYAQACCYETFAESLVDINFLDSAHKQQKSTGDAELDALLGINENSLPLSKRPDVRDFFLAVASDCYWRALGHKPTKLGGKIVTVDQFCHRRGKRIYSIASHIHTVDPSIASTILNSTVAEKIMKYNSMLGTSIILDAPHSHANTFLLRNTSLGCAALEMCLLFNLIPQARILHNCDGGSAKTNDVTSSFSPLLRFKCLIEQKGILHPCYAEAETYPAPRKVVVSDYVLTDDKGVDATSRYYDAFTSLNEYIREDKAALLLVYGVVCRECIRCAVLLKALSHYYEPVDTTATTATAGRSSSSSTSGWTDESRQRLVSALCESGWQSKVHALESTDLLFTMTPPSHSEIIFPINVMIRQLQDLVKGGLFTSGIEGTTLPSQDIASSPHAQNTSSSTTSSASSSAANTPSFATSYLPVELSAALCNGLGLNIQKGTLTSLLKEETWILPHAHYELRAVLDFYSHGLYQCTTLRRKETMVGADSGGVEDVNKQHTVERHQGRMSASGRETTTSSREHATMTSLLEKQHEHSKSHRNAAEQLIKSRLGGKFVGCDYNFEAVMEFRLHLSNDALSMHH